jgi:Flp pilus assembly protein TadD
MTEADFQQSASYWGGRYSRDPNDRTNAMNYAAALGRVGNTDQAVAVLQKAAIRYPTDREILAAYGKALAANGQL